mmetsp:Transcript_13911/g.58035  ORF Transcript_13911/g.58035 Transcript_13911/m.58035 type:complete len:202 (-) Transcript_13911:238-843(-)
MQVHVAQLVRRSPVAGVLRCLERLVRGATQHAVVALALLGLHLAARRDGRAPLLQVQRAQIEVAVRVIDRRSLLEVFPRPRRVLLDAVSIPVHDAQRIEGGWHPMDLRAALKQGERRGGVLPGAAEALHQHIAEVEFAQRVAPRSSLAKCPQRGGAVGLDAGARQVAKAHLSVPARITAARECQIGLDLVGALSHAAVAAQ